MIVFPFEPSFSCENIDFTCCIYQLVIINIVSENVLFLSLFQLLKNRQSVLPRCILALPLFFSTPNILKILTLAAPHIWFGLLLSLALPGQTPSFLGLDSNSLQIQTTYIIILQPPLSYQLGRPLSQLYDLSIPFSPVHCLKHHI